MRIFRELEIDADFIVWINCDTIKFQILSSDGPAGRRLKSSWFTLDSINIGWRPWCTIEWPTARFFPCGVTILSVFTFTFDVSLVTSFFVPFILKFYIQWTVIRKWTVIESKWTVILVDNWYRNLTYFDSKPIWAISTEKLGNREIFAENWLRGGSPFANFCEFVRHIWTGHTWRKSRMWPSIVSLAFYFPSTLWSPSNGTNGSTNGTRTFHITTI